VYTIEATEKCHGGTAKLAFWVFWCAGLPTRYTLSGPGDSHRVDVGWGELVILRPVLQLPGNPQAVVRSYAQGGTWRSLSGKLCEVCSALTSKRAVVMTLNGIWTRKKCFKHGVHLLGGGLKHTNRLTVLHYVVQSTSR